MFGEVKCTLISRPILGMLWLVGQIRANFGAAWLVSTMAPPQCSTLKEGPISTPIHSEPSCTHKIFENKWRNPCKSIVSVASRQSLFYIQSTLHPNNIKIRIMAGSRVYCSVYGCLNSTLLKPTLSFFKLPADAQRWVFVFFLLLCILYK